MANSRGSYFRWGDKQSSQKKPGVAQGSKNKSSQCVPSKDISKCKSPKAKRRESRKSLKWEVFPSKSAEIIKGGPADGTEPRRDIWASDPRGEQLWLLSSTHLTGLIIIEE